jgi:hypothetical protein
MKIYKYYRGVLTEILPMAWSDYTVSSFEQIRSVLLNRTTLADSVAQAARART